MELLICFEPPCVSIPVCRHDTVFSYPSSTSIPAEGRSDDGRSRTSATDHLRRRRIISSQKLQQTDKP